MSFRCDRVPGLLLFDTLQSQKSVNVRHAKILFKVENEAAEEIDRQLNFKKSHKFPRSALIASTF